MQPRRIGGNIYYAGGAQGFPGGVARPGGSWEHAAKQPRRIGGKLDCMPRPIARGLLPRIDNKPFEEEEERLSEHWAWSVRARPVSNDSIREVACWQRAERQITSQRSGAISSGRFVDTFFGTPG